jgi:hypothetical protein
MIECRANRTAVRVVVGDADFQDEAITRRPRAQTLTREGERLVAGRRGGLFG